MMTLTGNYVGQNFGAMSLQDIATGLSKMPRFGGQTTIPWTVADHVVAAAHYIQNLLVMGFRPHGATPNLVAHVLLHDAHEAMTGDIPTSFKTPDMKALQSRLDERIYLSLGLDLPNVDERAIIKEIDKRMLLAEARVVTPLATYERIAEEVNDTAWGTALDTVEDHVHNSIDAKAAFLRMADNLLEGASVYERR